MKEQLLKYTPTFIKENDLLNAIYTSIGNAITSLSNEIGLLKNANWNGKGLLMLANASKILFNKINYSEVDIQNLIKTKFNINKERGTESGISNDLENLLGSGTVLLKGINNCGIILNVTHPGIDKESFLDAKKVAFIDHTDAIEKRKTIEEIIFPIDIKIIYET